MVLRMKQPWEYASAAEEIEALRARIAELERLKDGAYRRNDEWKRRLREAEARISELEGEK